MKKGKAMVFLEPGQAARTKLTVSVEKISDLLKSNCLFCLF